MKAKRKRRAVALVEPTAYGNPFHKGQQVVDIKTRQVLGIVDEVRFGFLIVFRLASYGTASPKIETSRVRTALASVDENDVVHINKEALR